MNQALAHPLGANFKNIVMLNYLKKMVVNFKYTYAIWSRFG